jgi:hypothetical protein
MRRIRGSRARGSSGFWAVCECFAVLVSLMAGGPLLLAQSTSNGVLVSATTVRPSQTEALVQALEQAKSELSVEKIPSLGVARLSLQQALDSLEQFVQVGTKNGDNWSRFLHLPELKEQLASDRPSYPKLLELQMNMRQNYLGLEYPQFIRLREAIEKYVDAARFHTQEESFIRFLQQSLDESIAQLQSAHQIDDVSEFQLGNIVANLHQSHQAPSALSKLRSAFSRPNVRVSIDERLVNRLVSRTVAQPQPVDDCILGTRILGQAFLNGDVSAKLLPMNGGLGLQLNLAGCISSQNQGYNRGVVLGTSSISPVFASKDIYLSLHGISTAPPRVSTQLQSTIHSISHHSRLVRRIASRRAAKQKPQADAIAEEKMRTRLSSQFGQQVDEQARDAHQQLVELRQLSVPEVKRVGLERPQLALYSSHSEVDASAVQAASFQLAATESCPLPRPATALAVAQIHQSAVSNALEPILAGRVLRNTDLGSYARQLSAEVSDEMRQEIEGEPWSITFNPYRPVNIEFDGGLINITLRIIRMTRGDETLNEALSIRTAYLPSFDGEVISLSRQADVIVTSDRETRGVRATTLRSFIKTKFDKTFRESIVTDQIDLEQFPQLEKLRLNYKQLEFNIDQGWLQVSIP